MTERQGVEIDYCPKCRGVWLDRGELEKIIERSHSSSFEDDDDDRGYAGWRGYEKGAVARPHAPHQRKRESFFSRLFDFD